MMASVPQTTIMLLLIGWFTTARRAQDPVADVADEPTVPVIAGGVELRPAAAAARRHSRALARERTDSVLDLERIQF